MVKALDSQSRGPHLSKVDEMRDLVVKSKLSPRSGSVAKRQLNPIHIKG